jgi:non-homologous end joining protein Ku
MAPAPTGKASCAFRSSPVPSRSTRPPPTRVDADTREEVPNEDIVKAFKVDTDPYVEVSKEELENVALESTRTIEIDEFVARDEIDPRYIHSRLLRASGRQGRAGRICRDPRNE